MDERIDMARPRLTVDFAIVLRMHDVEKMGWSRMAEEYRRLSGEYVSRDTMKRRYFEAKKRGVSIIKHNQWEGK
jgi:hypothetical protein